MDEIKLLPCPFCGGDSKYFAPVYRMEIFINEHTIYCLNCGARAVGRSKLELVKGWNEMYRRANHE